MSVLGEIAPEGTELCYTTLQFYKQVRGTVNVDFVFIVVHDQQPVLEVKPTILDYWEGAHASLTQTSRSWAVFVMYILSNGVY